MSYLFIIKYLVLFYLLSHNNYILFKPTILKSRLSRLYSINNKHKTSRHEVGVEEMHGKVPMQERRR